MLDFVPVYAEKLPIIAYFWKKEKQRFFDERGEYPDFSTAFWSPPMTAQGVFDIEKDQINRTGLEALVSISDHDSITANLDLNRAGENPAAPISLEWTVPFEYGFFHVGVHNLPKERALEITQTLLDYTFNKEFHTNEKLGEMFALLNEQAGVLVVLNHPLWDIEMVGKERHKVLLRNFVTEHGRWIHAFEINGFRGWSENKAVIEMAESLDIPIVTGGDRHGCKPNTVINLSGSKTFEEVANEIRIDKRSEVVLMPEYRQPLHSRQLQSFSEILKLYPDFPDGRKRWFDRVHYDIKDGEGVRQLSVHWERGGPLWLRLAIKTLALFGSRGMRPAFAVARKRRDRVPKNIEAMNFEIAEREAITRELSSDAV